MQIIKRLSDSFPFLFKVRKLFSRCWHVWYVRQKSCPLGCMDSSIPMAPMIGNYRVTWGFPPLNPEVLKIKKQPRQCCWMNDLYIHIFKNQYIALYQFHTAYLHPLAMFLFTSKSEAPRWTGGCTMVFPCTFSFLAWDRFRFFISRDESVETYFE